MRGGVEKSEYLGPRISLRFRGPARRPTHRERQMAAISAERIIGMGDRMADIAIGQQGIEGMVVAAPRQDPARHHLGRPDLVVLSGEQQDRRADFLDGDGRGGDVAGSLSKNPWSPEAGSASGACDQNRPIASMPA